MYQKITQFLLIISVLLIAFSCSDPDDEYVKIIDEEEPGPTPPVADHLEIDLTNVPFTKLSDYGFFTNNIKDHQPQAGVLPFDLNSHLFTDYASKKRFIWMPKNVHASYENDHSVLNFPNGTILIKTFYYDNMLPNNTTTILETRLLIKKNEEWIFATYQWNEEQNEALLITEGATKEIIWRDQLNETHTITYKIPSNSECLVCHKSMEIARPIGPKPQNLNKDYIYEGGRQNQLAKWIEMGYLENNLPPSITSTVNWEDESLDTELRVRSYVDINCAHCHNEAGHCSYRDLNYEFNKTVNPALMGVCTPQSDIFNPSYNLIINPGNAARSAIIARMYSTDESVMMPMIGRTIVHKEAVQLMENYINGLQTTCN